MILLLLLCQLLSKQEALYQSLDPTSISQQLTFYELYKETPAGKKALEQAWKLLSLGAEEKGSVPLELPHSLIQPTGSPTELELSDEALSQIEKLSKQLPNRSLKGYHAKTVEELEQLSPEEIDLSRALLITSASKKRTLEATLDLMALQVLARLPKEATASDKVRQINQLIFYEMGFRFPPHSTYAKQIDHFTFLAEVLEKRRGVCLGVSTLYLCLAQRIGLELEIITPPGHIYLRTKEGLNIETTLRGVHVPTDEYLGINNRALQIRTMKEVIGMASYNLASVGLAQGDWEKARSAYAEAMRFMPDDTQLKTLYGCSLFLSGQNAKEILEKAIQNPVPSIISQDPLAKDLLSGEVDKEALSALFLYVDETHASLVKKKEALEAACTRCPRFRSGLFQLAITWLQLQRPSEALRCLERYHQIDPTDITVEFYLAGIHFSRFSAPQTVSHFRQAQAIAKKANFEPIALKKFESEIAKKCLLRGEYECYSRGDKK